MNCGGRRVRLRAENHEEATVTVQAGSQAGVN